MFSLSIPPSAPPAHLSTHPPNYSQKTHLKSPDSAMASQGAHNTPRPRYTTTTTTTTGGGREDCWSEAATETLVEAWGDRYLQLNRGNLRQKDWKEVADAVNGRHNGDKPRRTDVQCKNRVDTLKKKYKLERSKPVPSKWPFYSRLDHLVGASVAVTPTRPVQKPSTVVTLTVKSSPKPNPNPNPKKNTNTNVVVYSGGSSSKLNSNGSNESDLGGGDDDELLFGGVRKHRIECVEFSEETAYKELARAILRFGEIYERTENSKQQQMMELEKERMEFTKDLEFQRMNMFMEAQVELEKMKRPTKYPPVPGAGKKL